MFEIAKFVGGISWALSVIFLFVVPATGTVLFFVALLITLWVRGKDKERKQAELMDATRGTTAAKAPTAGERLTELDRLRAAGNLSDEKYEAKRQGIIDLCDLGPLSRPGWDEPSAPVAPAEVSRGPFRARGVGGLAADAPPAWAFA